MSRISCRIFSRSSSILRCFSLRRSSASRIASWRSRSASSSFSLSFSSSPPSPPTAPASYSTHYKGEYNMEAHRLARGPQRFLSTAFLFITLGADPGAGPHTRCVRLFASTRGKSIIGIGAKAPARVDYVCDRLRIWGQRR